jgi:RNA polymerase sigma factor (sigma-70 family)
VNETQRLAEEFERQRDRLRGVAYAILGARSDAEDAVQEAWLRLDRADADGISNLQAWLTTVVGRICLDMLRSRRTRREDYVGTWLPEPDAGADPRADPEQETVLAESVGLAMLVVLEQLSPPERLAFVLHDVFGVSFDEVAAITGRSAVAARQLATRARRRLQAAPAPDPDLVRQRRVVDAFLAAARAGDLQALVDVLDPDAVFRSDFGVRQVSAPHPVHGAHAVAERILRTAPRFVHLARPALVNGRPGAVFDNGIGVAMLGVTVAGDKITALELVVDPVLLGER